MIGMSYNILPTKEFSKDFNRLDSQIQKRIKEKVEEAAEDPTRYKHLHYDLKGSCRLRIGKWRVIFSYNSELQEMYLEKIVFGHKYRD
ncbi:type II toxin-antitoxin system RelE/ParE family toxin [Candidatus Woesearchaeota archaeon]|nr:type II toxin-antitoxin system RelE/ParE family toxin [Candidatus Woesearchaeota archaeon]